MRIAQAAILGAGLLAGSVAHAADDAGGRAVPRIETARATYHVGERFDVTLRIDCDLTWLLAHTLQTSRRTLDLPISVEAPWMQGIPGALDPLPDARPGGERISIALGGTAAFAEVRGDALVVTRRFVARRAGAATLAAPVVRFDYAERFEDDLVHGRVPIERRHAVAEGLPLALTIRDLPAEGRPATFSGGIGRFEMSATADRSAVTVGEHVTLRVRITGDGNLDAFDPPPAELAGFHVVGILDDRGAAARTVQYELAPLAPGADGIPGIALDVFDPTPPASYRRLTTAAIPLTVVARPGDGPAPPAGGRPAPPDAGPSSRGWVVVVVALAAAAVAVALALRRRRSGPRDADPVRERALAAAAALHASDGANAADALAEYLAARLGCSAAAVISPELPARLGRAGVERGLADRASVLLERLVAARYGGGADAASASDARALVAELERAFDAAAPR